MAIDKGGLDYSLTIRDEYSRELKQFRALIDDSIKGLQQLKKEAVVRSRATAEQRLQLANQKRLTEQAKAQSAQAKKDLALEKSKTRELERQADAKERARSGRNALDLAVQRRLTQESKEREAVEARIREQAKKQTEEVKNLGQNIRRQTQELRNQNTQYSNIGKRLAIYNKQLTLAGANIRKANAAQRSWNQALAQTNSSLRQAVPLFGGFFASILASEAIRGSIRLIEGFIGRIVSSSAAIEDATLGIASLISALSDITGADGELLEGFDKLDGATTIAAQQVAALKKDAIATSATFEDLLIAFQTGLAPGIQAGLGLDEIRQFTLRLSQAAAAINLPQEQLAEEIRSILTGDISPRDTRIAIALGITNEDIKRAKEAGDLFEFLQSKFEAFGVSGVRGLENFTQKISNLQDAVNILLQTGGVEFFEAVKDAIDDLIDSIIDLETQQIKPEVLEAVQVLAEGLKESLDIVRQFVADNVGGDVVEFANKIANGFIGATRAIVGVVEGLNDIISVVTSAGGIFGALLGGDSTQSGARALTVLAAVAGALSLLAGPLTLIANSVRFLAGAGLVKALASAFGSSAVGSAIAGAFKGPGVLAAAAVIGAVIAKQFIEDTSAATNQEFVSTSNLETARDLFEQIQAATARSLGGTERGDPEAERLTRTLDLYRLVTDASEDYRERLENQAETSSKARAELTQFLNTASALITRGDPEAGAALAQALPEISDEIEQQILSLNGANEEWREYLRLIGQPIPTSALSGIRIEFGELAKVVDQAQAAAEAASLEFAAATSEGLYDRAEAQALVATQRQRLEISNQLVAAEAALAAERRKLQAVDDQLAGDVSETEQARLLAERELRLAAISNTEKQIAQARAASIAAVQETEHALARQLVTEAAINAELENRQNLRGGALLEADARVQQAQLALREQDPFFRDTPQAGVERARIEVQQAINALELARQNNLRETKRLEDELRIARLEGTDEEVSALEQRLSQHQFLIGLQEQELDLIKQAKEAELERAQSIRDNPIFTGFEEGFARATNSMIVFQDSVNLALNGMNDAVQTLSDSLWDTFVNGTNTWEENFRRFALSFLKQMTDMIIKALVLRAIQAAGFGLAGGGSVSGGAGFAGGGLIPHSNAKGFADGGQIGGHSFARPAGLHPTDTVPIWAAPGEFMMKRDAVNNYGLDFMESINQGLLDPTAALGLMRQRPTRRSRGTAGRGFADGGSIPNSPSTAAAASASDTSSGGMVPVLVASDRTVETMLTGGNRALLRVQTRNSAALRAATGNYNQG